MRCAGVNTADWLCWDSIKDYSAEEVERLGYPVMVKPCSGGSSIGMEKVSSSEELLCAVQKAFACDQSILIESYIQGQEITCSILNGELLPILGITSANAEWFDYSAKYEEGGADERVIELPTEVHERVREAALSCYKALKCSVYARVDMLLKEGIPYVLEVNTLPGMTKASLLPKSAQAAGYTFSGLLDEIISLSLTEKSAKEEVYSHA